MAKIGIFGGTFNPPHMGHVLAAKEVKDALGLDRIILVPDANPPHKELPQDSPTPEVRLQMVEAAVAGVDCVSVSDLELIRSGRSYTSDTLRQLKTLYPDDTLYLIMGTDMFLSLHTWHEPEAICALAVIVAMEREEKGRSDELKRQKQRLEEAWNAQIEIVDNRRVEISSTMVRRMLILGGAEKYVAPAVLDMIYRLKLYGTGESYRGLSDVRLRQVSCGLLKNKRVAHVLGCAETAVKLAEKYGGDTKVALRAGLLHDVTKAIDGEDQLLLVDKYGIIISKFERNHPKLLHAKTGAAVAEKVFGESDAVVEAIYWHTTGRPNMTLMEKIIYLADYMEPTRSFPGVEALREAVWKDLDEGLAMALEMSIQELIRENKTVCRDSQDALEYIRRQLGACGLSIQEG